MKVNVEELSSIERQLSIEVESARVAEEFDRAYSALSRQVKIAGFRPGKVPRRILEQRFKDQIVDDVIQRVVEKAYIEAIREHKVDVVSTPKVTPGGLKLNEPFTFHARVEVKPKIEAKDYSGLPLKKREVQIDEARVDERISQLREEMGRLEPVTDRDVAQSGDLAQVSYKATVDGKPFSGSEADGVTVQIAPGDLLESKVAALEGTQVGQEKEIEYAFPADYSVKEVAGKVARFKIRVDGLKTRIVPELNDAFAKDAGAENLAALREDVKKGLSLAEQRKAQGEEREEMINKLIERNAFEVPKAMVDRATDSLLRGAFQMMARSGLDVQSMNLDIDKMRDEMRPKALLEVKGSLLFEAIADKEKIEVSDEDIDKRIDALAEDAGQAVSALRKQLRDPDQKKRLVFRLREEKTVEFLKANASYS